MYITFTSIGDVALPLRNRSVNGICDIIWDEYALMYCRGYCPARAGPRPAGRAGPQPMGRAGPGLNNILRAGPGAGLKLEGPGRARACKY